MAENSGISWTHHTFNPWMGCTKVSPACKNCYAERDMDHRYGRVSWGPMGTRVMTSPANWAKPLKWNREAEDAGVRYRVFCASLADVFEDWTGAVHDHKGNQLWNSPDGRKLITEPGGKTSDLGDMRSRLFALIDATPNLDWLLLTKRPENIRRMWCSHVNTDGKPPSMLHRSNVWLGCTVESQLFADKRIPELLNCRDLSPVLFLSCEPLLGAVDLLEIEDSMRCRLRWWSAIGTGTPEGAKLDWVIAGGESGPSARPSHPDWFRLLRDQCDECNVPFHFKQWGEWKPFESGDQFRMDVKYSDRFGSFDGDRFEIGTAKHSIPMSRVSMKNAGRLLDGKLHDAFPEPALA